MNNNRKTMHSHLGDPTMLSSQGQTVWETLEYLHRAYNDLEVTTANLEGKMLTTINDQFSRFGIPRDFSSLVDEMRLSQHQLDARLVQMEDLLRVHTNCFNNIRPVLERISTMSTPSNTPGSDRHVTDLGVRLDALEKQISTNGMDTLYIESISACQEEIRLLKQRIVGSGITIGPQIFQSYRDFVVWIKTNLPSG
jgi:hypothetical protein